MRSRRGFFPTEIDVLYFINRESLFLCLRYIKHVLSKLGATKCAPAGAFFHTQNTPIFYGFEADEALPAGAGDGS